MAELGKARTSLRFPLRGFSKMALREEGEEVRLDSTPYPALLEAARPAPPVDEEEEEKAAAWGSVVTPAHFGIKQGHYETSIIHFPTSEGVSEVSKRANE